MKNLLFALTAALLLAPNAFLNAQTAESDSLRIKHVLDSIEQSFKWQTGKIDLSNGMASIQVPAGMRYLNPEQSEMVLTQLWGNPPGRNSLGMLFPADCGPLSGDCWAFDISFDDMGYVKDNDADDINYTELLENMQKDTKEGSAQRVKMGYEPVELIGWASQPYYDKTTKVLHWAKELKFGEAPTENTLNYDVRVLGRKGVLSLNAIGTIGQINKIKGQIPSVISSVGFNEGHRYADFDSNVDEIAAWSIGGLVAGKVLAKAGFFAIILKFIKPLLIALVAFGGAIWRFITGRRKQEEEIVEETVEEPVEETPVATAEVTPETTATDTTPDTQSETATGEMDGDSKK